VFLSVKMPFKSSFILLLKGIFYISKRIFLHFACQNFEFYVSSYTNTLFSIYLSGASTIRVNFDSCTVDMNNFCAYFYNIFLQSCKKSLYYTVFAPSIKSYINCVPIAILFLDSPPLASAFYSVQQCVHER